MMALTQNVTHSSADASQIAQHILSVFISCGVVFSFSGCSRLESKPGNPEVGHLVRFSFMAMLTLFRQASGWHLETCHNRIHTIIRCYAIYPFDKSLL